MYTITDGRVAAVVSGLASSKIRPERANLKAHQAVLKRLIDDTTPLPDGLRHDCRQPPGHPQEFWSGIGAPLRSSSRAWPARWRWGCASPGTCPISSSTSSTRHTELRLARDRLMSARHEFTQEEKIELGRMFDRLLNEDREDHTAKVERVLAPLCAEFKANPCRNEHEVINLACLVKRDAQEAFSAGVFAAAKLFDNNFAFDYSGPWAPHNFVELDLEQ